MSILCSLEASGDTLAMTSYGSSRSRRFTESGYNLSP